MALHVRARTAEEAALALPRDFPNKPPTALEAACVCLAAACDLAVAAAALASVTLAASCKDIYISIILEQKMQQ